MSTQKIKKSKNPFEFWQVLTWKERAIICVPMLVLLGVCIWLAISAQRQSQTIRLHTLREETLKSEGEWDTFKDFGVDVWLPKELEVEEPEGDLASYMKLRVDRDNAKFPWISVGVIQVTDASPSLRITGDSGAMLDAVRPHLQDAIAELMNGIYPTVMVDIGSYTMEDGSAALEAVGTATCTVMYQDPKDPENPYAEEVETNIYYIIRMFAGRPVVVWATWDYSTYDGENRAKTAVVDAANSLCASDGVELVEADKDTWDEVEPKFGQPAPEPEMYPMEPIYWDENQQGWVDTESGTVDTSLPPPGDKYWEEKYIEAIGSENYVHSYGYEDGKGNWIATTKNGLPLGPTTIPTPEEVQEILAEQATQDNNESNQGDGTATVTTDVSHGENAQGHIVDPVPDGELDITN